MPYIFPQFLRNYLDKFSDLYKKVFSVQNLLILERSAFLLAILLYVFHIAAIWGSNVGVLPAWVGDIVGYNYLSSITTPFTVILIFEVLLLIVSTPRAMVRSVAIQYEIVSLVLLRQVFKDISHFDNISQIASQLPLLQDLMMDMGASLLLFFLIVVYSFISKKLKSEPSENRILFLQIRQIASFLLVIVFLGLGVWDMGQNFQDIWYQMASDEGLLGHFFARFFLIMILVDVVLVMLAFVINETYDLIFRDAALFISIIFVRLAFTLETPYSPLFALVGIVFGILTNSIALLYNYANGERGSI